MKLALKGRDLCAVTDIIKNATKELKSFFQNMVSRNVSHTFTVACRRVYLHKGRILKEM